jgi:hypothetical protein
MDTPLERIARDGGRVGLPFDGFELGVEANGSDFRPGKRLCIS